MDLKNIWGKVKKQFEEKTTKISANKKHLKGLSLSFLAFLILLVVIYFANGDFSVKNETDTLVNSISNRNYAQAHEYYEKLQKELSTSKMNKVNDVLSKKLATVVVNSGEKYIDGEITKEQYAGLISTINALEEISIKSDELVDISKRVRDIYINENITYEKAYTYMEITTSLNNIYQDLDEYKNDVDKIYKSRQVYKDASKKQQIKKYKEAIEGYSKVLEEDKKYYTLAKNKTDECIKAMYDYYISSAKSLAKEGEYEDALLYLTYLKPYYPGDDEIEALENEYREKVSIYNLSSSDILNLISKKSSIDADLLSVISYQKNINDQIYYYAEVSKDDKVINEVLIEPKTKKIYSYKSEKLDYECTYCDGYYKMNEQGKYIFAISKEDAAALVKEKLSKMKKEYKKFEMCSKSDIEKYVDKDELNQLIEKNNDIYYYALVKSGWFSLHKDVYLVNMYNKSVYGFENQKLTKF